MVYDFEKRTFLVEKFIELKSYALVQRAFRTKWLNIKAPSPHTIKNIYNKFKKTGSVHNISKKGQYNTNKREEATILIENLISEFPKLSMRRISQATKTSTGLTHDIMTNDLCLKPYKIHDCHRLLQPDFQKRVDFAEWYFKTSDISHDRIICTDEAYFYLTEPSNKQNNRLWLNAKPQEGIERPLHEQKILVFCAISAAKVYGPYFFSTSVNQHNYLSMLQDWFWPKHLRTDSYKKYYFQQDGATPHTANLVQNWMREKMGKKFMDKSKWPPRSPDLNPCDYFLWGYLKQEVYNPLPKNLEELKVNIERETQKIPKNMLNSTFLNFEKRLNLVINAKGGHIENK